MKEVSVKKRTQTPTKVNRDEFYQKEMETAGYIWNVLHDPFLASTDRRQAGQACKKIIAQQLKNGAEIKNINLRYIAGALAGYANKNDMVRLLDYQPLKDPDLYDKLQKRGQSYADILDAYNYNIACSVQQGKWTNANSANDKTYEEQKAERHRMADAMDKFMSFVLYENTYSEVQRFMDTVIAYYLPVEWFNYVQRGGYINIKIEDLRKLAKIAKKDRVNLFHLIMMAIEQGKNKVEGRKMIRGAVLSMELANYDFNLTPETNIIGRLQVLKAKIYKTFGYYDTLNDQAMKSALMKIENTHLKNEWAELSDGLYITTTKLTKEEVPQNSVCLVIDENWDLIEGPDPEPLRWFRKSTKLPEYKDTKAQVVYNPIDLTYRALMFKTNEKDRTKYLIGGMKVTTDNVIYAGDTKTISKAYKEVIENLKANANNKQ